MCDVLLSNLYKNVKTKSRILLDIFFKISIMDNPFSEQYSDYEDIVLVGLGTKGDKQALQNLIVRHQLFVYNLALKMTGNTEDAEDLTQEAFIKAITSLSKFEGKSNFRTWLYRITVNHFLNSKKRKSELNVVNFESYFNSIDSMPSSDLNEQEESELKETIEELRISCTTGMLMCLSKEQRMVYVLGELFDVGHNLGGEILEISAGNFRIKLMRARKDIYQWMNNKCGLVNKDNPCRCSKKTKAYIKAGKVDSNNLQFNIRYRSKIKDFSKENAANISDTVEELNRKVFKDHPMQDPVKASKVVNDIFNNDLIKWMLKL